MKYSVHTCTHPGLIVRFTIILLVSFFKSVTPPPSPIPGAFLTYDLTFRRCTKNLQGLNKYLDQMWQYLKESELLHDRGFTTFCTLNNRDNYKTAYL